MDILTRWRRYREHLRFTYLPEISKLLRRSSTVVARNRLAEVRPLKILLDNSVLGFAVTHESAWISTGTKKWGGVVDIDTGYLARVPVHSAENRSEEYLNIRYLPGIAELAADGFLALHTSAELTWEQWRQPVGRFKGYSWFDQSLFKGAQITTIDSALPPGIIIGPGVERERTAQDQQRRLDSHQDELHQTLTARLGPKHGLDAWHIRTAEKNGLFCFLTMDFKLARLIKQLNHLEPIASLSTKVMTPMEFGEHFGIRPIAPHLLSYDDASYPVRADLHMPNERRRPRSQYRK